MRPIVAAVLALAALPAAAHPHERVRGDGDKTTVKRELPPFTRVRLVSTIDAQVKVGPAQSVAVTIDSNLQPHVALRVEDGTLVVDSDADLRYRGVGRVELTVPALRALSIEGSADASIDGGEGELGLAIEGSGDVRWSGTATGLRVAIEGSGDVLLEGKAEALEIAIEGSGDVSASGLTARGADVSVAGSGDVDLRLAGGTLRAQVSGSGDVRWSGEAKVERTAVSGSGRIVQR